MFKGFWGKVKATGERVVCAVAEGARKVHKGVAALLVGDGTVVLAGVAKAEDVVPTIPALGIDWAGLVTSGVAAIGVVMAAAIGGGFAITVGRMAYRWVKGALRG